MRSDGGHVQYVLGHSAQELDRLERQSQLFASETRALLQRAGLKPGMKVLDVGCGVGDVAMIAAEIVGREGSVLGLDRASQALSVARARAERAGHASLHFEEADIFAYEPTTTFDAAIGRFILMHVADPVGVLKRLTTFLNPSGVVAFLEMDIDQAGAIPPLPLLTQCIDWITATYRRVGVEPNMGSGLYAAFRAAGLDPHLAGTTRIESGADAAAYGFAAQTVASLMPAMDKLGIATSADIGIDSLAARLRDSALAGDHCILMPRLIGAWAKKA
jgi:ubiquinone/menaquinone biosynthesis C-methylase UbiE